MLNFKDLKATETNNNSGGGDVIEESEEDEDDYDENFQKFLKDHLKKDGEFDSSSEEEEDLYQNEEERRNLGTHMEESEVLVTIVVRFLEEKYYKKFVANGGINKLMEEIPVKAYQEKCQKIDMEGFLKNLHNGFGKQSSDGLFNHFANDV